MKFLVYGTLKRGYGNNRLLQQGRANFLREQIVPGYKLYNAGFPVAIPNENSSILCELWEISPEKCDETVKSLDRLEGEGRMYNRVEIERDTFLYVGHPNFWNTYRLEECPMNGEKELPVYYWERAY